MMQPIRMRYETWVACFKPIKNHLTKHTAIDGYVFRTEGNDLDFVRRQAFDRVWTFFISDETRRPAWLIGDGFHAVNAMGYIVTRTPYPTDKSYLVSY